MKVTTESGAVYRITKNRICYKTDHYGHTYPPFKIWVMKSLDPDNLPFEWSSLNEIPTGPPEIGKRLYVAGREEWWISTRVVSIEEDDNDNDE